MLSHVISSPRHFHYNWKKQSKFETSVMPAKWQVWRENGNCGQLSPSKTDWSHFVLSNCFRMRGTYWFSVTITTLHSFLTKNGKKKQLWRMRWRRFPSRENHSLCSLWEVSSWIPFAWLGQESSKHFQAVLDKDKRFVYACHIRVFISILD